MEIGDNIFEIFLSKADSIPGARVGREEYLKKTFKKKCKTEKELDDIIKKGPINAGISLREIGKIADQAIKNETIMTTAISFATGIPGGMFMGVTIPGDVFQFYVHTLIALQKLMYLYGWEADVIDNGGDIDDETRSMITLCFGTMHGVKAASNALVKLATINTAKMAKGIITKVAIKSMMKGGLSRTIIIKIIRAIGIKSTLKNGAKIGTKAVPVIGGVLSGAFTMATFIPAMKKIKNYFETGKICNINNETDIGAIVE